MKVSHKVVLCHIHVSVLTRYLPRSSLDDVCPVLFQSVVTNFFIYLPTTANVVPFPSAP